MKIYKVKYLDECTIYKFTTSANSMIEVINNNLEKKIILIEEVLDDYYFEHYEL